jgi:glucose-6-phosphate isomerase
MPDAATTEGFRIPDGLRPTVDAAIERAVNDGWAARIWQHDASVWSDEPEVRLAIGQRLGWLDVPAHFHDDADDLRAFAAGIREAGIDRALVCGMGGSSLAPEVLGTAYPMGPAGIPVGVLDSTDPETVALATESFPPGSSLYIIASKSGTTTETLAFLAHFWALEHDAHREIGSKEEGDHFVAVSDPEEPVDSIPHSGAFRAVFLNPPDIGGRYAALSYVGLVPAALLDLDVGALLAEAAEMAEACQAPDAGNPGVALGATLGALAGRGRDTLTLVIEPAIASFGEWLEQLVAESTGKHGQGILPVVGEPLASPDRYREDRVFVRLSRESASDWRAETDGAIDAIAAAGHPVIELVIPDGEGLGGEFFRWQFATAVAGAVMGINPFDEPDVAVAKAATARVLAALRDGHAPTDAAQAADAAAEVLADQFALLAPDGYVAIQAYLPRYADRDVRLAALREVIRERTGAAVTLGHGPRYLHSTGQLHKGGPADGLFIQLVGAHADDILIPGSGQTFGMLIDAQSLGDAQSLDARGLPVVRIQLGEDPDAGLDTLIASLVS